MDAEEAKREETPESSEHTRRIEEQLLSAKDGLLRLWERTRHLQECVGRAERRLALLTRLLVATLVGSTGVGAVLLFRPGQATVRQQDAQEQVAVLQAQVQALQERIRTVEHQYELLIQHQTARSEQNDAALAAAIRRLAPEIIAAAFNHAIHVDARGWVGIGTANPESPLHVVGNLLGAATSSANEALRIAVGQLEPHTTRWVQYATGGIYVDVDTSSAGFSSTPLYFTSLGGHTNNWLAQGATSIYSPTPRGFRVHVSYPELTVAKAREWGWYINWLAVGK
ncbi:MAG: hypothetical protein NZ578_03810 [Candidatus Binatia bacterium]|nr:hypothetical protein [Candidatus Binatia bacterium]